MAKGHLKTGFPTRQAFPRVAHLPDPEDPDPALIVGIWGRLADEIKQRLIEMVRAKLPTRAEESEFQPSLTFSVRWEQGPAAITIILRGSP